MRVMLAPSSAYALSRPPSINPTKAHPRSDFVFLLKSKGETLTRIPAQSLASPRLLSGVAYGARARHWPVPGLGRQFTTSRTRSPCTSSKTHQLHWPLTSTDVARVGRISTPSHKSRPRGRSIEGLLLAGGHFLHPATDIDTCFTVFPPPSMVREHRTR